MIYLIGTAVILLAFAGWEIRRLTQRRHASVRRRERSSRRIVRSKAWDMVFARRAQRRLSFDPAERRED